MRRPADMHLFSPKHREVMKKELYHVTLDELCFSYTTALSYITEQGSVNLWAVKTTTGNQVRLSGGCVCCICNIYKPPSSDYSVACSTASMHLCCPDHLKVHWMSIFLAWVAAAQMDLVTLALITLWSTSWALQAHICTLLWPNEP